MHLIEKEIIVPINKPLINYFKQWVNQSLDEKETPIRFAITATDDNYHCEVGVLVGKQVESIFNFRKRDYENGKEFNAVMLVPTGIGCEIGGHAGDATPAARLLAGVADTLIVHPNVVNASDINEMPPNSLYVEGSVISDLLMGTCGILPNRANKIILLMDKHPDSRIRNATINAVSAARAAMGIDCKIIEVEFAKMSSSYSSSGRAVGRVEGLERICEVLDKEDYDAVALTSIIDIPFKYHTEYFEKNIVNPWGGVEAILSHALSKIYKVPVAHAPMFESTKILNLDIGIIDPRKSAEAVSMCFLYCILKGLHQSPRITNSGRPGSIRVEDISCLIIPEGCIGLPTLAAMEQGIPVIAVRENRNIMRNNLFNIPNLITVNNYLEAAGVMAALKTGVSLESVRRPLKQTEIK